jgi:hypothetical protein
MPAQRGRVLELGHLDADLLRRILLRTPHDDLLRWLALCAQVCRDWRHIALQSVACGSELPRTRVAGSSNDHHYRSSYNYANADDERTRVLKSVSESLRRARTTGKIQHPGDRFGHALGEQGCRILGTAMQSLPKPLSIHTLNLCDVGLTPECVRPITAAMRLDFAGEGLKSLMVANNTGVCRTNHGLGDEGVAMVAAALPPTLQELLLNGTDCGSRGLVAVASVLPTLRSLKKLTLDDNCSVYGDGDDEEQWDGAWVTLAAALPLLPALHELGASCVMNDARLMALAAVLPRCSATLVKLHLTPLPGLDLGEAACSAVQAAWGTRPSNGLIYGPKIWSEGSDESVDDY